MLPIIFSKKKSYRTCFLLVIFLTVNSFNVQAGHAGNMELTYRHITGNTYEFTLYFFRNCLAGSASAPTTIVLSAQSQSLGTPSLTAGVLTLLGGSVSQPPNIFNCIQTTLCYESYTYRGLVNLNAVYPLNPNAKDWVFSYELCCWTTGSAAAPQNIVYGDIRTECGLNNLDFPAGNNSPLWHEPFPNRPGHLTDTVYNYPFASTCSGREYILDQQVKEYEGDLMKYEFVVPLTSGGVSTTYQPGYSFSVPLPFRTPPGFEIDSFTGQIEFIPDHPSMTPGNYVITIKANEWRMDTVVISGVLTPVPRKVGYVMRNLVVLVEDSASCPDNDIAISATTMNIAMDCNDTTFRLQISDKFLCETADSNGSFVKLIDQNTGLPVSVHSAKTADCWQGKVASKVDVRLHTPLSAGSYILTLQTGTDGNTIVSECGNELIADKDTTWITVDSIGLPAILGSPDTSGGNYSYVVAECGQDFLEISFDEKILCSSIEPSGSDFLMIDSTGSTPIVNPLIASVAGVGCKNGETNKIRITFGTSLEAGHYGLVMKQGTDGNSVSNICGEEIPVSSDAMPIRVNGLVVDLGPDLTYCKDSLFMALLEAGTGFSSYQWSTGHNGPQYIVITKGTYYVTVENHWGCQASDTVVVREIDCHTGAEEHATDMMELFPNPTEGKVYLWNKDKEDVFLIQLTDIKGNVVYEAGEKMKKNQRLPLDFSSLAKGLYFLKISTQKELIRTEKIVIE